MALYALLVAVGIGYLCGSLPWGLWLGRWVCGLDVRQHGSRNLGATNVYRVLGPALGVVTLVLDVVKGAFPVWLVPALPVMDHFPGGREWCSVTVALAAVTGHVFTLFAGFQGGKGVATTLGVLLAVSPPAFVAFLVVFVVTVAITRYISVGSVMGSLAFAYTLLWVAPQGARSPLFLLGVALAVILIARHRENFRRLARGEERRFSLKGGSAS